ncbi:type I-E CRISPR-associated protein Cse2/CasB [Shewanella sp. NIFS-20-20]|uniref:type I-E CRISPR-associated protein Cse2/CasB n=1 Tax=Shewanella sp. NIFS-20-20 TaxID=2853806 RepID=UPI001C45748D|nr:type I-E CRISPR-associated protein Cse2/CasB [Shewanella sp. NIFS-20-20]MBV7315799.1 type I-E CRISPR-associated protein Cse2/CasB [Shewanella sp. NIFS-20-20]
MSSLSLEFTCLRWWQTMFLPAEQLKEYGLQTAPTLYKAQLKRCESLSAIMLTEGFRALWLSLPPEIIETATEKDFECWATLAGILVYVKSDSKQKLAQAAGSISDGDKSVVSELRFAQLQDASTAEELLRRMRRILQQVNNEVAVTALIKDVQKWFAEHHNVRPQRAEKRIAVQWAMEYYRAASAKK